MSGPVTESVRPTRVALVCPDLEHNTISYFASRLAVALRQVGVEVAMFCTSDRFDLALVPDGVGFHGGKPGRSTGSAPRLRRFFESWRPDVVLPVLEQAIPGCRLAAATLRTRSTVYRVVPILHHPASLGDPDHRFISRPVVKRLIVGKPKLLFTISDGAADDAAAVLRLARGRFAIVPPAYDATQIVDTVDDAGPLRLVTVSRLVPLKRHDLLLSAVRLLADRGVDVHLTIVGDGELRAELQALTTSLALDDLVTITGWVDDPAAIVRRSQLYVSASDEEGFGMAILEAIAAGVPALAVDALGGGPRFISGDGGLALIPRWAGHRPRGSDSRSRPGRCPPTAANGGARAGRELLHRSRRATGGRFASGGIGPTREECATGGLGMSRARIVLAAAFGAVLLAVCGATTTGAGPGATLLTDTRPSPVVPPEREAFAVLASMDWPRAATLLSTLDQTDPLIERSLALALYHSGSIEPAVSILERRRTNGLADVGELELLAEHYEAAGQTTLAEELLSDVLAQQPGNDKALAQLGQLLLHGPDPERSRPAFEELYGLDPADYSRILLVGIARRADGDVTAATAASDELVARFPTKAEPFRERAWNLLSIDDFAGALAANDNALELDRNDPATLSQRDAIVLAAERAAAASSADATTNLPEETP